MSLNIFIKILFVSLLAATSSQASATSYTATDLGTLGGIYGSNAHGINNSGQVVGVSNVHAFLYSNGAMTDLGTLGGTWSGAFAINDSGQIVGYASTAGLTEHAFLYSNGAMADLGTLGGDSVAYGINSSDRSPEHSNSAVMMLMPFCTATTR